MGYEGKVHQQSRKEDSFLKYYSILLISSLVSSTLFAVPLNKRDAIQELVQKLEALDPNIKSHQDDWLKVRNHLEPKY